MLTWWTFPQESNGCTFVKFVAIERRCENSSLGTLKLGSIRWDLNKKKLNSSRSDGTLTKKNNSCYCICLVSIWWREYCQRTLDFNDYILMICFQCKWIFTIKKNIMINLLWFITLHFDMSKTDQFVINKPPKGPGISLQLEFAT